MVTGDLTNVIVGDVSAVLIILFAIVSIVSALLVVTRKNPVLSIIFLCVTLVTMAGLFVLLHAHFIAAVQILVYAGAIMVLFLFVVMLLNAGDAKPPFFIRSPVRSIAIVVVVKRHRSKQAFAADRI